MPWRPHRGEAPDEVSAPDLTEDPSTYRGRFSAAARARGVPLATIVTAFLIGFAVLDLNALVILLLWVLRTEILYAVVGTFIAILLSPAVRLIQRTGLPRGFAVVAVFIVAVLAFFGVVGLLATYLVPALVNFAKELPHLIDRAEHGHGTLGHLLVRLHLEKWVSSNVPKFAHNVAKSLQPATALKAGQAAFSTVVAIGEIAVLALFILLEAPMLQRGVLSNFHPERAARIRRVYHEATRSVTGYVLGNVLTSLIAGVVVVVTLSIMGVPYPILLGTWVALVDLLPLVGGLLAGVPVVIIAAFHSPAAFVVTLIVFLVYQQIENHILNPVIMSRTVRLNPLWVLLAVLVGATLGGRVGGGLGTFAGALLGIPLGGAVQVVSREIRRGPSEVPLGAVPGEGPSAVT